MRLRFNRNLRLIVPAIQHFHPTIIYNLPFIFTQSDNFTDKCFGEEGFFYETRKMSGKINRTMADNSTFSMKMDTEYTWVLDRRDFAINLGC